MKMYTRTVCIITAIIMALSGAYAAFAEVSDTKDTGIMRVYLKSLGNPQALLITVEGEYAVDSPDGMRIKRGARLALAAQNGEIIMSAGDIITKMGGGFTLVRLEADDGAENGLYIHESERNALYEGDLRIVCAGDKLGCVLTIGMEDYLCGVVAYEMSDSFPIEALKAQAVAARTYAMSRRAARVGEEYDVTDTTSDQVYKGFVGDYENVIQAVRETAGVVGVYKGKYAGCYYTASNGGQVSTPNQVWGGSGDYGYIQQKDDPYDLENPSSLVNDFYLPENYDPSNALWAMAAGKLSAFGHADVRPERVTGVSFGGAKHEGSRMYTEMYMDIGISSRDIALLPVEFEGNLLNGLKQGYIPKDGGFVRLGVADWADKGEVRRVVISVYGELKDELGLGLNSSDYETVSAEKTDNGYSIQMRRFGHGTGMSQRGAQTMAGSYSKDWREILGFYYPGMELITIDWQNPPLPRAEELPDALINEMLLIPPEPEYIGDVGENEYIAAVVLDSAKSRLNVRAEPSTNAAIVVKLDRGYRVLVCEDVGDGWVQIRGGSFEGFVKSEYLSGQ